MTTQETLEMYDHCLTPNYKRLPVVMVRGQGSQMWDADGRRYLDLFPGWGCSLLGYSHPRIVEAIQRQATRLIHIDNTFHTEEQARLGQLIQERSFNGALSFFCNSGAEANEAAIKLARRHVGPTRYKIITMERSFHGRTYGAMSATAQSKVHHGHEPLVPGFVYVPYNNLDAVRNAISDETAAVLVEPIQGEGGVRIPEDDYLAGLRELCSENGMLLIFDEVQTGCGRTGRWFGHQHAGVEPDIMTLAKALGGGAPIGALVAQPEIGASLTPGSHASTYGGNPLCVAAAIAMFETVEAENLLERVATLSACIMDKAHQLARRFGFIESVRGRGLMIGIDLSLPGAPIVAAALERGLRLNVTQDTTLRLLPAMTITTEEIDEAFDILAGALQAAESKLVTT